MNLLRSLYERLRATFPPNRLVALLAAPAAAVAGYVATWVAEHFPGVSLDENSLTAIFIAGVAAAIVTAYKWLDGWAHYERGDGDIDGERFRKNDQLVKKPLR